MIRLLITIAALCATLTCTGFCQESLLRKQVFLKAGATLREGSKSRPLPLDLVVQDVEGEWVLVSGVWVDRDHVMVIDEALKYYNDLVEANPKLAAVRS